MEAMAMAVADEAYEFDAPRWFNFLVSETDSEIRSAERWFHVSSSHAPSPFMPRIKERRSVEIGSLCDFESAVGAPDEGEEMATAMDESPQMKPSTGKQNIAAEMPDCGEQKENPVSMAQKGSVEDEVTVKNSQSNELREEEQQMGSGRSMVKEGAASAEESGAQQFMFPVLPSSDDGSNEGQHMTPSVQRAPMRETKETQMKKQLNVHTPKLDVNPSHGGPDDGLKNRQQPSAPRTQLKSAVVQSPKSTKLKSVIKSYRNIAGKVSKVCDIAQENQAIKRQKLDDGRSRQILNVKARVLPHKSRGVGLGKNGADIIVRCSEKSDELLKDTVPFVSAAEMVKKFESSTRNLELPLKKPHDAAASAVHRPQLMLTRPKEPALRTAHRVRAVRVKSSEELEAEILAKMPKFRARPFNKKILDVPPTLSIPRSTPQPPEFQEFNLKTMERANRNADTSSETSVIENAPHGQKKLQLTQPKAPQLETSIRARPPRVKSTQEIEIEELQKIPKFKAKPLNRKILEKKSDAILEANSNSSVTEPIEFHFSTDDRLGPALSVARSFDKMSLHSDTSQQREKQLHRTTVPNPFQLRTEERGSDKERQLAAQLLQKKEEEEKARIPKANPYPYTTDYPVVPPKPEPKPCTKPEGFQLESLVRHEEEMLRKLEERQKLEKEEKERRIFKAQPVLKEDPIPLAERVRLPLTEVQDFTLHIDHRSLQRAEFDQKIKEKEMSYKRIREENEHAQQIEEEKALKQLRRTLVPNALPLPRFDHPFVPRRSTKSTTKPRSPHLLVKERGTRTHAFMR